MEYFNFRIIPMSKDVDIIDTNRVTPVESLSGVKLMEYIEVDKTLLYSKRQEKRENVNANERKSFASILGDAMNKLRR